MRLFNASYVYSLLEWIELFKNFEVAQSAKNFKIYIFTGFNCLCM